jgi:ectoine hydroxylase-related dioxygenase (phytanoyl-CoA dioxygenase family)
MYALKLSYLLMFQWVKFYHEHVLNKEPGAEKATPWHHDQSYYPINGDKVSYAITHLEITIFWNVKPCNLVDR